jgi:uncharacterized damage-inducible protein DinB
LLVAYDAWANRRVLDACTALSHDQFSRGLGSSFSSVRDTLTHIVGAQWVWLERFHGRIPSGLPKPEEFPDFASLRSRFEEVERGLASYVELLSPTQLESTIEYRNLKGDPMRNTLWHALQHIVNHGTYHRGQVATLLRQLGVKPASSDLIAFYRERAAAAASHKPS